MKDTGSNPPKSPTSHHENGHMRPRGATRRGTKPAQALPRGVTVGTWPDGRPKKYFVRYGPRHARKLASYELETDRDTFVSSLVEKRQEQGVSILDFDPAEWRRYLDFRQRCPASFVALESLWLKEQSRTQTQLVKDAVPRYLALRLAEDIRENSDTHRHLKLHLGRLVTAIGALRLDEVTPDIVRDHLATITSRKTGKPIGNLARRHHRKDWNTFFKRCVDEEWCGKNPCTTVKPPRVEVGRRKILTPEQAFALFKANAGLPVIGRLALEAFGALRASSAERILGTHINWSDKGLELTKDETDTADTPHKSGVRRYRQGHPAVLWLWLESAPAECWTKINRNNYGHKKGGAFLKGGVTNTGNVLRHSCISYLLALVKSYGPVGYLAQHSSASTTMIYEGLATEAAAKLYLSITPEAVRLSWAEFEKCWARFYVAPKGAEG